MNAEALNSDLDLESTKGKKEWNTHRKTHTAIESGQKLVSGAKMINDIINSPKKEVATNVK